VFENRVLGRIFGTKTEEVTERWRKFHNRELRNLYSSTDIITRTKSWRMSWADHIIPMGEKRNAYKHKVS
jgi:uncharacterized membrane protein